MKTWMRTNGLVSGYSFQKLSANGRPTFLVDEKNRPMTTPTTLQSSHDLASAKSNNVEPKRSVTVSSQSKEVMR